MKTIEEEVKAVLSSTTDEVAFEEPLNPADSPINQPVIEVVNEGVVSERMVSEKAPNEKVVSDGVVSEKTADNETNTSSAPLSTATHTDEQTALDRDEQQEQIIEEPLSTSDEQMQFDTSAVDDVPEQEIGSGEYSENPEEELSKENEAFEIPASHAKRATDAIFGIADNVISVGGGFFIKIKKHKEFYDFQEVIQIIDEQNDKNVKRLKLDEEDKILLRPLLIAMLKQKAKKLTPEQQLLGAVLSILMKKAQVVMEIKAENEIMVDRILDVIREEKGYSDQDIEDDVEEVEADNEQETEEEISKEQTQTVETTTEKEPQVTASKEKEEVHAVEIIEPEEESAPLNNILLEVIEEKEETTEQNSK